jgi:ribosomal protein S18 acetylase RimI-like enzyme
MVYSLGIHHCDQLPGFIAWNGQEVAGLVTYSIREQHCEIVSLDSLQEGKGIGTLLLQAVERLAQRHGLERVWLITTNDNLHALRFYQKRGYELVQIYRNAVAKARKIKPEIPLIGHDGIPIRDEIELEKRFSQ